MLKWEEGVNWRGTRVHTAARGGGRHNYSAMLTGITRAAGRNMSVKWWLSAYLLCVCMNVKGDLGLISLGGGGGGLPTNTIAEHLMMNISECTSN
jgi:hypothetical protein